jgi:hypothetical protein
MTADLNSFVQYLRWSDSRFRCPAVWKDDYVRFLKNRAAPLLNQDERLGDAVNRASEKEFAETLLSPRVMWALTQDSAAELAIDEMLAELVGRQAMTSETPPSAAHGVTGSDNSRNRGASLAIAGIGIDFDPSFEFPGEWFKSLAATPLQHRASEYERIKSALRELRQGSPAAFVSVKDLTLRIAVRLQPEGVHLIGSFTEYPGVMLIVNPWLAELDLAQMIEAIVHENIHHAIAMFEPLQHDLTPDMPASPAHQSPWTGKLLTCHQFVEACFVWWGLYQMWLNWPVESCLPRERSGWLRDRAFKGFRARPATALLEALGETALPKDTVEALLGIEYAAMQ